MRNVIFSAVNDGALVVPRAENSTDGTTELFPRVFGKILAGTLANQFTETIGEGAKGSGIELGVGDMGIFGEELFFQLFDDDFKRLVFFARAFLNSHHDVSIHLEEAAVTVVGEPLILAPLGQGANRLIVQAEIKNGVHHAWHRVTCARADGNKKRIFHVPKLFPHGDFHFMNRFINLLIESRGVGSLMIVEVGANLGADGETGRNREPNSGHFR